MKKTLVMMLVFSLILLNCGNDSTEPGEPYDTSSDWTVGLVDKDWFPGVEKGIFVSVDPFDIKDDGNILATTYAFIKIIGPGKIVAGLYADKNKDNTGYNTKTREETIAYAKSLTTELDNFSVIKDKVTYKRTFNKALSEYAIQKNTYTYNRVTVYEYRCNFDMEGSIHGNKATMTINVNIADNDTLKVYRLNAPAFIVDHFYLGENNLPGEADKLLYKEYTGMRVYFHSYTESKTFERVN